MTLDKEVVNELTQQAYETLEALISHRDNMWEPSPAYDRASRLVKLAQKRYLRREAQLDHLTSYHNS